MPRAWKNPTHDAKDEDPSSKVSTLGIITIEPGIKCQLTHHFVAHGP